MIIQIKRHGPQSLLSLVTGLCFMASVQAQEATGNNESSTAPIPTINPAKTRDELQSAYQKEYAFLDTQVRDLEKRLFDFGVTSSAAEQEKEALIDRIEGEYIDLQIKGERIDNMLEDAERQVSLVEDSRSMLEATFQQAKVTFETYHTNPVEGLVDASDGEKIDQLLNRTFYLLASLGKIRQEPGSFFLKDGTEVQGTLTRIGNVALYGVSAQGSGALAPAGDNRFKIWSDSNPETAEALASGQSPDVLQMFLFESSVKAIEESIGKTVLSIINSGGAIAWIIVSLGGLAALLVILRTLFLRHASAATGRVTDEVSVLVKKGNLEDALQACKRLKGSTSRVVAAAVRNLDRDRVHVEDIVSEQILHESAHLNRFGAFIIVIAAVAPLLGLLGTVTGMIATFDIITEFGTGDPKLLSSGISIALVTTEIGLIVAIPALVFGNLLSGWSESIKDDMEKAALHVMNLYLDRPVSLAAAA